MAEKLAELCHCKRKEAIPQEFKDESLFHLYNSRLCQSEKHISLLAIAGKSLTRGDLSQKVNVVTVSGKTEGN